MRRHLFRRSGLAMAAGVAAIAATAVVVAQVGGGYDLSFSGITGGGGESSGGGYVLYGSIGQPVAGDASGGGYALGGGLLGGGATKYKRFLPHVSSDGVP